MSFPNIAICELDTTKLQNDLFNIDRLEDYIPKNTIVHKSHSHNFYHFAFLINGTGHHVIDFKKYEVLPNSFYFMKPHEVHSWCFSEDTKGFVINFSATFLDSNFIHSTFLNVLPYFQLSQQQKVLQVTAIQAEMILHLLQEMYAEQNDHLNFKQNRLAFLLANFLVELARIYGQHEEQYPKQDQHAQHFHKFQQYLEQQYLHWKHPKEFAAAMNISLPLLQKVTKEFAGISAGALIRERILLEAKRLLIQKEKNINEIAFQLNFSDNSYFTKFFKKYNNCTPEQFRAQYQ